MTQIYILWIALSTEKKIKIEYFKVKLIKFWWLTSQRCLNKYILTSSLQVLLIALLYVLEYTITTATLVSFQVVFRDVTQRYPPVSFGGRVALRDTPKAKETGAIFDAIHARARNSEDNQRQSPSQLILCGITQR